MTSSYREYDEIQLDFDRKELLYVAKSEKWHTLKVVLTRGAGREEEGWWNSLCQCFKKRGLTVGQHPPETGAI